MPSKKTPSPKRMVQIQLGPAFYTRGQLSARGNEYLPNLQSPTKANTPLEPPGSNETPPPTTTRRQNIRQRWNAMARGEAVIAPPTEPNQPVERMESAPADVNPSATNEPTIS